MSACASTTAAAVSVEEGWVGPLCDRHLLPRVSGAWNAVKLALDLAPPETAALAIGVRSTLHLGPQRIWCPERNVDLTPIIFA